jgi:hypothetical protein
MKNAVKIIALKTVDDVANRGMFHWDKLRVLESLT